MAKVTISKGCHGWHRETLTAQSDVDDTNPAAAVFHKIGAWLDAVGPLSATIVSVAFHEYDDTEVAELTVVVDISDDSPKRPTGCVDTDASLSGS